MKTVFFTDDTGRLRCRLCDNAGRELRTFPVESADHQKRYNFSKVSGIRLRDRYTHGVDEDTMMRLSLAEAGDEIELELLLA